MFDAQLYRTKEEVELWKERDPIPRMQAWLADNHMLSDEELARIESRGRARRSRRRSPSPRRGTLEPIEELERFPLMDEVPQ